MTISIEREAWVCEDCYLAHHGYNDHLDENGLTREGNEPLGYVPWDFHVLDNTCSNHDGDNDTPCSHCAQEGTENGIDSFSWRRCDGCGSTLGGSRYRLSLAREA